MTHEDEIAALVAGVEAWVRRRDVLAGSCGSHAE